MKNPLSLSVVLPAYNEAKNIKRTVTEAVSYAERSFNDYEVIVVNDGSTDGTGEIVEELTLADPKIILVNHAKNSGYGAALRSGFDRASLDYLFLMDSDGQFDISDIERFLPFINTFDIIVGYREKRADPAIRSLNTWLYHLYVELLFGLRMRDMDCAFKMFTRRAYEAVKPIKSGGALFSAELIIKWKRKGFSIKEVPVRHFPRKFGRQTGANVRVILRMFRECWKLRNELRE